jgi:hypothetical protein
MLVYPIFSENIEGLFFSQALFPDLTFIFMSLQTSFHVISISMLSYKTICFLRSDEGLEILQIAISNPETT